MKNKIEIIWEHTPHEEYPSYWHESDIEKMMDEFGKWVSIAFTEWMLKQIGLNYDDEGGVGYWELEGHKNLTTEELYNLFLQHKSQQK